MIGMVKTMKKKMRRRAIVPNKTFQKQKPLDG